MPLDLYSEPYRPEGNIDARAARRVIGQGPSFGFWDLVLRETLQNSWDARTGIGPLHYRVDCFEPTERQQQVLADEVFQLLPPKQALGQEPPGAGHPVLIISDWGTRGLGGPTRADIAQGEHDDFVDFVRNVGRAESKALGGGTYGFGKSVLYDASIASAVLMFTRTHDGHGRAVSRLLGICLGSSYERGRLRYTGRHWWGIANRETGAEPLTGRAAENLARKVGLTQIPEGETGTSLMILGPVAIKDDETLNSIVHTLAEAALYWAWPHMLARRGRPATVQFSFNTESGPVELPDPRGHPVLRDHVAAFERAEVLQRGQTPPASILWTDTEIRSGYGQQTLLGVLSYLRRFPGSAAPPEADRPDVRHSVALLREPRVVVRYRPAPQDPLGRDLAGAFLADPALDGKFALSEPVAHDDWIPRNVPTQRYERNPVRQALDRLEETLRPRRDIDQAVAGESDGIAAGLVALSSALGSLLDGQPGGVDTRVPSVTNGIGSHPGTLSAAASPHEEADRRSAGSDDVPNQKNRIEPLRAGTARAESPTLRLVDDTRVAVFPIRVAVSGNAKGGLRLSVTPRVVIDGGLEAPDDSPAGADLPAIIGWSAEDDETPDPEMGDKDLVINDSGVQVLWVWVRQPADTAVTIVVSVQPARVAP